MLEQFLADFGVNAVFEHVQARAKRLPSDVFVTRSGKALTPFDRAFSKYGGKPVFKSKREWISWFRAQSMKAHPDRGGSTEDMQNLNNLRATYENSPEYKGLPS